MIIALLAGICLYVIYRKLVEIKQQYRHIDDETVKDYMTGRLRKRTKEYHRTIQHLGLCEACQQKMIDYDDAYISSKSNIEDHLIDREND